ncbi:EamA family transporter [Pseudonocardia sp.]|jgi:drug/metabolite transporter (DMT)-like permease|uniref:EamA family transporter n=1 Tax=Pseudonocardia sp. TaxID=60912 RepID=UPI0031FBDD35
MSVPVAFPAALAYGVADFAGGLAARRAPLLVVTLVAQAAGLLTLLPAAWLLPGRPAAAALGFGALAGVAGTSGLLLYLRALAVGPMGVIAPLSAVVGAGLPLVVGVLSGEPLGPVTVLAIVVALAAILLATVGSRRDVAATRGLALGLGAGVGFGLFFVALAATPADSGLWPLLGGRVTSVTLLAALVLRHQLPLRLRGRPAVRHPEPAGPPLPVTGPAPAPFPTRWMIVSGVFDTVANVLFLLSARLGDLGVSAVVVSLYPVVVVLLARLVLRERLTAMQLASAGLALGASVLLATAS